MLDIAVYADNAKRKSTPPAATIAPPTESTPVASSFVTLEVGADGLWLAVADTEHNVIVASLNKYFEANPTHRADFWTASVLAPEMAEPGPSTEAVEEDSDSGSEESGSEEEDGEDEDEDDGGGDGRASNTVGGTVASSGARGAVGAGWRYLEDDMSWTGELSGYSQQLDSLAKAAWMGGTVEHQWFESEGHAQNISHSDGANRRRMKRLVSSSSLLPVMTLGSSLAGDSVPTVTPGPRWDGLVYLEPRDGATLQGMVLTSISCLRFFHATSDASVGDLDVYHFQTKEKRTHRLTEPAAIVKCGHDLPALHLTETSFLAFVMQTTRRELVDELIMFEHTALAEHLSTLNGWNRNTLNSHQLETSLKYRQLDVVDRVLESLDPDQLVASYGLVVKTVEDATRLSKGVDFAQRLLRITTKHLNAVVEKGLAIEGDENPVSAHVAELVGYMCRLRANLIHPRSRTITTEVPAIGTINNIPSQVPLEGDDPEAYDIDKDIPALQARNAKGILDPDSNMYPKECINDFSKWESLSGEEIVQYALRTDTVLNAQIYLALKTKANQKEMKEQTNDDYSDGLSMRQPYSGFVNPDSPGKDAREGAEVKPKDEACDVSDVWTSTRFRARGLSVVFESVCCGDVNDAVQILKSLGENVQQHLRWIYSKTSRTEIRQVLLNAEGDPAGLRSGSDGVSSATAFMANVSKLYNSEDILGSVIIKQQGRGGTELEDLKDLPYQKLVPLTACEPWMESNRASIPEASSIVDDSHVAAASHGSDAATTIQSEWYSQLLVDWVKDWDEVTRGRILLEAAAGDYSTLDVDDVARWHFALVRGDIDGVMEVAPDASGETLLMREHHKDTPCRLAFIDILIRWKLADTGIVLPPSTQFNTPVETDDAEWRSLARAGKLFAPGEPSEVQHATFLRYAAAHKLTGPALRYTLAHSLQDLIVELSATDTSSVGGSRMMPWISALGELLTAEDDDDIVAVSRACSRLILGIPTETSISIMLMVEQQKSVAALATMLLTECGNRDNASNTFAPNLDKLSGDELKEVVKVYPLLASQLAVATDATKAMFPRVTLYDLLRSCTNLDFGAQATAAVAWQGNGPRAEMPHFSGTMTEQYGPAESLDYLYYLGQGRPFHSFQLYQANVLDGSSSSEAHMLATEVRELAISHFRDSRVASGCLLFLELVHEESAALVLREELTAARRVFTYRCRMYGSNLTAAFDAAARDVAAAFAALHHRDADRNEQTIDKLLNDLQKATDWQYGAGPNGEGKVSLHAAGKEWRLVNRIIKQCGRTPQQIYLHHCADAGAWLEFLAFSQIEAIDPVYVDRLAGRFKNVAIRQHIRSAVRRVQRGQDSKGPPPQRSDSFRQRNTSLLSRKSSIGRRAEYLKNVGVSEGRPASSSAGTPIASLTGTLNWQGTGDLFDMLFLCNGSSADPTFVMIGLAMAHKLPYLAVFASSIKGKPLLCICAWLYATHPTVIEDVTPVASEWTPADTVPWRNWSWSDLLAIILALCAHSLVATVREALSVIKLPGSPLIHIVDFCERFAQHDYVGCAGRLRRYLTALLDAGVTESEWDVSDGDANRTPSSTMQQSSASPALQTPGWYAPRGEDGTEGQAFTFDGSTDHPPLPTTIVDWIANYLQRSESVPSYTALKARATGEWGAATWDANSVEIRTLLMSHGRFAGSSGSSGASIMDWTRIAADSIIAEMLQRSTTAYERKHLLRLLCEAGYSKHYNKLYQTFIILSDVGDEIPMDIEPEAIVEALASRKLFDEAYAFAKAHGIASHLVTLRSVESRLGEFQHSCLWDSEKARLGVWSQFQQVFQARSDNAGTAEVAGSFFVGQVHFQSFLDNVSATAPAQETVEHHGQLSLRERIVLLSTGVDWLKEGEDLRPADELQQLERETWVLRIQLECETEIESQTSCTGKSISLCGLGNAADGEDTAIPRPFGGDILETDSETLFAECNDTPDLAGEAEHRALDALIGQLLTNDRIADARNLATLFKYKSKTIIIAVAAQELAAGTIDAAAVQHLLHADVSTLDLQQTLQALTDQCGEGGRDCCRRVLSNFNAAHVLNISYQGMLADDPLKVLRYLLLRGRDHFELARRFIRQNWLPPDAVTQLLSALFVQQIAADEETKSKLGMEELVRRGGWSTWNTSDFAAFANVCMDPAELGQRLVAYVSEPDLDRHAIRGLEEEPPKFLSVNVEVELLCRAHYCFVLVCSMDVIGAVLTVAKDRVPHYVEQQQFDALVKLLCNIKRFREMEYILDLIVLHGQFELLLGKDVMADDVEGRDELKMALRDYLIRMHPEDAETLQMVSLTFQMYREIGENRLHSANLQIKMLGKRPPGMGRVKDLLFIVQMLSEAASHLLEQGCLRRSRWCFTRARLVGLQIQMVDKALLNLSAKSVAHFISHHPNFRESLIVAEAYDKCGPSEWVTPIFQQVVLGGNEEYLDHIQQAIILPASIFTDVMALWLAGEREERQATASNFRDLLETCRDKQVALTIASQVGLGRYAVELLQAYPLLEDNNNKEALGDGGGGD
jgi:hypothetical protein